MSRHTFYKITFLATILLAFFVPIDALAALSDKQEIIYRGGGIGVGSIIAIVASWTRNKSVLWAILHACFGWLYVIYYVLTR